MGVELLERRRFLYLRIIINMSSPNIANCHLNGLRTFQAEQHDLFQVCSRRRPSLSKQHHSACTNAAMPHDYNHHRTTVKQPSKNPLSPTRSQDSKRRVVASFPGRRKRKADRPPRRSQAPSPAPPRADITASPPSPHPPLPPVVPRKPRSPTPQQPSKWPADMKARLLCAPTARAGPARPRNG